MKSLKTLQDERIERHTHIYLCLSCIVSPALRACDVCQFRHGLLIKARLQRELRPVQEVYSCKCGKVATYAGYCWECVELLFED